MTDSFSFRKEVAVTALAVDAAGRRLAVGYEDGRIVVADRHGDGQKVLAAHLSAVTELAFTDSRLLSVSYDRILKLWDVNIGNSVPVTLATYPGWLYSLVATGDERVVCGGSFTGVAYYGCFSRADGGISAETSETGFYG